MYDSSRNKTYLITKCCCQDSRVQQLQGELEAARQQLLRTEEQLRGQQATKQQLKHLQQQLTEVRQQHLEQLRSAEIAREAAELRAIDLQSQQEQRYRYNINCTYGPALFLYMLALCTFSCTLSILTPLHLVKMYVTAPVSAPNRCNIICQVYFSSNVNFHPTSLAFNNSLSL